MKIRDAFNFLSTSNRVDKNSFVTVGVWKDSGEIRVGYDHEFNIVLLVSTPNNNLPNRPNYHLKRIEVQFNVNCLIHDQLENSNSKGEYTIVRLLSSDSIMKDYFIKNLEGLVANLKSDISLRKLTEELDSLIEIFSSKKRVDREIVIGLWGELLFIFQSKEINAAIDAWHVKSNSLIDFVFQDRVVEVKTTSNSNRLHKFRHSQLKRICEMNYFLISIVTQETTNGMSVIDLWDSLLKKEISVESELKLKNLISATIGADLVVASDLRFDMSLGLASMKEFHGKDLPILEESKFHRSVKEILLTLDLDLVTTDQD